MATGFDALRADHDIVQIRDLRLPFEIGLLEHEHGRAQMVSITVEMAAPRRVRRTGGYVSYADVADRAIALSQAGHIRLVETLAETLAETALANADVARVRVTILKEDIYPQAGGVGITIEVGRDEAAA